VTDIEADTIFADLASEEEAVEDAHDAYWITLATDEEEENRSWPLYLFIGAGDNLWENDDDGDDYDYDWL
jgi:hypothetical protein